MSSCTRSRMWTIVGVFCVGMMVVSAAEYVEGSPILGNMNCDGIVDASDIAPFTLALMDPGEYAAEYPGCNITRANINGDDAINAADIQAFTAMLLGHLPAGPRIGEYGDSGCLEGSRDEYPWCGDDAFEFAVEGDTLFAVHRNATYNCCPDDIVVHVSVEDGVIFLTETEVLTMPCDCMCCYDVDSAVVGLEPGQYTVHYCWEDWETGQVQCYETEISVQQGPRVLSYADSGCLDEKVSAGLPCPEDDVVEMVLDGDQLHITHSNATYNCCPDEIAISMVVMGNTLMISEEEVLTHPCFCICCYDVMSTIGGLAPGTYTVQYCWYEEYTWEERCHVEEIVVPVPPPVMTDTHDSGCLGGLVAATDDWEICPGDDEISLAMVEDQLVVVHGNATYNCCADNFTVEMEAGEYTILLIEDEVLTTPCYCLCCYDVTTSIGNLAEGRWTVTYCWYDEEWGEDRCVESELEVAY